MVNWHNIRDARPGDAPFLAKCILSGMHFYDFETYPSDHMAGILSGLTASETLEDTLYTFRNTRVAELNGAPAGALLSYPGEEYLVRRERTFREFWPEYFSEHVSAGRGPSGSSGRSISQSTPMTTPRRTPESGTWIPSRSFPSTGGLGSVRPSWRTASGKGSRRGSTGWLSWRTRSTPILSGSTSRWGSPRMGPGTPSGRIS